MSLIYTYSVYIYSVCIYICKDTIQSACFWAPPASCQDLKSPNKAEYVSRRIYGEELKWEYVWVHLSFSQGGTWKVGRVEDKGVMKTQWGDGKTEAKVTNQFNLRGAQRELGLCTKHYTRPPENLISWLPVSSLGLSLASQGCSKFALLNAWTWFHTFPDKCSV